MFHELRRKGEKVKIHEYSWEIPDVERKAQNNFLVKFRIHLEILINKISRYCGRTGNGILFPHPRANCFFLIFFFERVNASAISRVHENLPRLMKKLFQLNKQLINHWSHKVENFIYFKFIKRCCKVKSRPKLNNRFEWTDRHFLSLFWLLYKPRNWR